MSLTLALRSALSGLSASQIGLGVTASNITNANTEGYTRKVAQLKSQVIGNQSVGGGVTVAAITRNISESLQLETRNQATKLAEDTARFSFLDRIQGIFGAPSANSSLTARLTEFTNQLESIAVNPNDPVRHTELLSLGRTLANQVRSNAGSIQELRADVDRELETSVSAVNTAIDEILQLNEKISRNTAMGLATGDLEDQRDMAVNKIAEQLSIRVFKRDNNELVVYTASGFKLVDNSPQYLDYTASAQVQPDTLLEEGGFNQIGLVGSSLPADQTTNMRSGRMQGLLDLRDNVLPDMASQLENISRTLKDTINAVHNQGTAFPPPQSLTGTRTLNGTDPFLASGTLRLAITNSAGAYVDYVDVDMATATAGSTVNSFMAAVNASTTAVGGVAFSTLGQLSLVNGKLEVKALGSNRIAIGNASAPAATATENVTGRDLGISHYFGLNDFFTSRIDATNPSRLVSSDTWRLTDSFVGTGSVRLAVTDAGGAVLNSHDLDLATLGGTINDLVNAVNTAPGLGMTASIGTDGKLRLVADNSDQSITINLLSPPATETTTGKPFTSFFDFHDTRHSALSLEVRPTLIANPQQITRGTLNTVAITPPITVPIMAVTAGDATNAQALADSLGKNIMFPATRSLNSLSTSLSSYATLFLSASAHTVAEFEDTYRNQLSLQKELEARSSAVSGVDIEQEMANLVLLENAYNAAARVVKVTSDMLDQLETLV
jgi:flagellar hook-associated protein 1 FlgK